MSLRRLLLFLPLALAACEGSPSGPLADLRVFTDANSYTPASPILISVENPTDADAFFHHCGYRIGFVVQKRAASEWVDWRGIDGPVCPAIYMSGIKVLFPGSAYEKQIEIDEPGTYRAAFETATSSRAIGSQVVYSNSFEVE